MVEAMKATTAKFASRNAMGVRELLSEEDEKQPNGRIFKKSVYGDYHWNTFSGKGLTVGPGIHGPKPVRPFGPCLEFLF